ncbi:MAG: hypothetical protein ACRDSZ_15380 [Pseudonocardiaceae bacterium]
MTRIHALGDSRRAKLATLPRADHNGRYEVDENVEPIEPTPVAGKGDRR